MEKAALAQEKVWFDKPSYDKAERLYFEQMAKVVSRNIMECCSLKSEVSISCNCRDIINSHSLSKTKSEKAKDNRSLICHNITSDILKHFKCQPKGLKTIKDGDDHNVPKKDNKEEKQKNDGVKNDTSKKCNAKEVKEKINKADTRHKNRGKGKNETKEVKENVVPLIKNEQQLPNQGNQQSTSPILPAGGSLANEIAKARQHIKQSLQCVDDIAVVAGIPTPTEAKRENLDVNSVLQELRSAIAKLEDRMKALEDHVFPSTTWPSLQICPAKPAEKNEDDGELDLFGSDSEEDDAADAKKRKEILAAYNAKKSKKPVLIAKSNIILDVKPWDDETDMKAMETEVRKVECDGLLWGASKLVPLAFGIHKLQISCVVEDEKVSVDWLTEKIQEIEDFVQSVDIAAFNKV